MENKLNWIQLKVAKLFNIPIEKRVVYTIPDMTNVGYERRSGRSIRLVNMYVELLFATGIIKIRDHHPTQKMDDFLFNMVIDRLRREHSELPIEIDPRSKEIILDRRELSTGDKRISDYHRFPL